MIQQISVFLENRAGQLLQLTDLMAKNNINLQALLVADNSDYGVIRMITDDSHKTYAILKDKGYIAHVTPVTAVAVDDKPGTLNSILSAVAEEGVNLEYMYSLFGKADGKAYMLLKTDCPESLDAHLAARSFTVIDGKALGIA